VAGAIHAERCLWSRLGGVAVAQHFIYLGSALGSVAYETHGFATILARANNFLNYRYVIGFRVLSEATGKRCEWRVSKRYYKRMLVSGRKVRVRWNREFTCGRRAIVGALIGKGDKKFMVHLCEEHFTQFLLNAVSYVKSMVANAYEKVVYFVKEINPLYGVDFTGIDLVVQGGRLEHG
jgi:hypothetical protein